MMKVTQMGGGKHCPACGKDIGVWPIFSAGLPNRIWCPHCSRRLQYRGVGWLFLLLLVVLAGIMVGAYLLSLYVPSSQLLVRLMVFGGVTLGAWVPVELAVTVLLRRKWRLTKVHRASSESDADSDSE